MLSVDQQPRQNIRFDKGSLQQRHQPQQQQQLGGHPILDLFGSKTNFKDESLT